MKSLRTVLSIVPSRGKRSFWFLLFLAIFSAGVEIVITSLVALLAAVFASTEAVLNNPRFLWLKEISGSTFLNDPRYLGLTILCVILLMIAFKNLLAVYQQWQIAGFSESISKTARRHLFRFYLRAPFLWVLNAGSTELLFGLNCCAYLGNTFLIALQVFSNSFMLVALCVGIFVVAPVPALIFLVGLGGVGYTVTKLVRKYIDKCAKRNYEAEHRLYATQQTAVHGLKEMRIYGREASLHLSYSRDIDTAKKAKQRQLTAIKLPVSFLEVIGFFTLVAVMCYLVFIQNAGMAKISGIMGFMAAAAWRALPVANRTVESLTSVRTQIPYIAKAAELIEKEKELTDDLMPCFEKYEGGEMNFRNSIRLEGISFRYPSANGDSLHNVSFEVKKGQMVGVVGFSGAGKSTLVNVLSGLIPHGEGRIFIDSTELTKKNTPGWLKNIGYVAQSPFLLDATLAENIALSRWGEGVDCERVLKCCEMAALDFVNELEEGIDTVLGDRGVRLSGGEAQRVAIARSLYSEPDLIIFDEATSALDIKNEQAIHRTVLSLHNQVTTIIIAHRLTTVENCDYIIWLDKGKVRMQGSVEDVLGVYKAALKIENNKP